MHICFVEDTTLHGGTQIWVSEAMRVFLAEGHDVTLLTAAGGFNAEDGQETGARVVTYDFEAVIAQDARHERIWTEALEGTDVAVCTVHPPRADFHCSRFAARCIENAKLGTTLMPKSGTIVPEYLAEYYAPPEDIRYHAICITNFTRDYLIDTYKVPAQNVSLIYQGTDVERFSPDEQRALRARDVYSLPEKAYPVLGSVGSFEHRKGQVVLLEAVARMRDEHPDVHLMLVGDGPDEEMLNQKVVEMGLGANVTFFPFTREPQVVFERLDILVLSSLYKEGLPNVLLEAFAMGLPVVSSRMAGVPEVVFEGKTGHMVEPDDAAALAAAISDLASDRERCKKMGAAGRTLMEEQFDKRRQFHAFLDCFEKIRAL